MHKYSQDLQQTLSSYGKATRTSELTLLPPKTILLLFSRKEDGVKKLISELETFP